MSTVVLTLRIPTDMKNNLELFGKSIHRSKSYIAEKAIEAYLKQNAWQIKELHSAEQEISKGKFIEHKEVEDYLETWGYNSAMNSSVSLGEKIGK